jgi:hypothetical protein
MEHSTKLHWVVPDQGILPWHLNELEPSSSGVSLIPKCVCNGGPIAVIFSDQVCR